MFFMELIWHIYEIFYNIFYTNIINNTKLSKCDRFFEENNNNIYYIEKIRRKNYNNEGDTIKESYFFS